MPSRIGLTTQHISSTARCAAHFGRLAFDGTTSGRAYIGQGDALRFALHRLGGELTQWARASMEVAASLRASADRYDDADQLAAARIA